MNTTVRMFLVSTAVLIASLGLSQPDTSEAAEWVHEGMAEEGKITAGFRVGPSFATQDSGVSTVGPLINFQGMYDINRWFRIGMILECSGMVSMWEAGE